MVERHAGESAGRKRNQEKKENVKKKKRKKEHAERKICDTPRRPPKRVASAARGRDGLEDAARERRGRSARLIRGVIRG